MFFLPLRWTERVAAAGQRRRSFLLGGLNSYAIQSVNWYNTIFLRFLTNIVGVYDC
ncbi:MAG: hypothetical protein NTW61_06985 [Candidatus Melainabacteria bacterium]|nr:hypothetical protein [Candidatus Melainabacteria bacterium]